ncbi:hypothetical protein HPB47_015627 [Ixodes persulcatus]|uniref:Uncharacterized protein n=1 Tax=Ixodes persulcatus TaxID=34615 RepID=A0AC60QVK7_IXOPE|nr:hypothetical protein HPB47_015627 [Ixodes persulcatus]
MLNDGGASTTKKGSPRFYWGTWALIRFWEDRLEDLQRVKKNGAVYAEIAAALEVLELLTARDQEHSKIENICSTYRSLRLNCPLNFVAYHFGYRQRSRLVGSRQQLPELFPDDVSYGLVDVWNTGAKVAARRRSAGWGNIAKSAFGMESAGVVDIWAVMGVTLAALLALLWYSSHTLPWMVAIPKPALFLLTPSYWKCSYAERYFPVQPYVREPERFEPRPENLEPIIVAEGIYKLFAFCHLGRIQHAAGLGRQGHRSRYIDLNQDSQPTLGTCGWSHLFGKPQSDTLPQKFRHLCH